MKQTNHINISGTYEYKDYYIDIIITSEDYEAWLYQKESGIKHLMFGVPQKQQTFAEFLRIVEANVDDFIETYDEEMDNY